MRRHLVRRGIALTGGGILFLVGVIGFAHTPAGRPMLGAMGRMFRGGKACPLGYDRAASPQMREQGRARFAATHRGQDVAAGKPALGFVLDRTTKADVLSFMTAHGITCLTGTTTADVVCEKVASDVLPSEFRANPTRDLWFNFGVQNQLISLVAVSRDAAAPEISAALAQVTGTLERQAGPVTRTTGGADARSLAAGSLRQATKEFAYADYYARARATNMGQDFLLTEEYRSLAPARL